MIDATPANGIIRARDIASQSYIAAPGVPLGVSSRALEKGSDRILHDPLQIGVATMAMAAVKHISQMDRGEGSVGSHKGI